MEPVEPSQAFAVVTDRRASTDPERPPEGRDVCPGDGSHAFRSGPFRIFMAGCVVSWVGDWMDLAALNWAVLKLTGSAIDLGLINACRLVPVFLLSLPAGVLADRLDRRRLLIGLQVGAMLLTFAFAILVALRGPFWLFALAVAARSILVSMATPVRNALLPNLVPVGAIAGAVASQAALMNLARIVGPALAGVLLAVLPMDEVFWINGASYLAVLATLICIRPVAVRRPRSPEGRRHGEVREAFAFVRDDEGRQSLLILSVVPMIFGFPYTTLMPLFARDLFDLGRGIRVVAVDRGGRSAGRFGMALGTRTQRAVRGAAGRVDPRFRCDIGAVHNFSGPSRGSFNDVSGRPE